MARRKSLRPLTRKELRNRQPVDATRVSPYARTGLGTRTVFVSSPSKSAITHSVKIDRVDTRAKGSPIWQVRFEVEGDVQDHLSGQKLHPQPLSRPLPGKRGASGSPGSFRPRWRSMSFQPKSRPRSPEPVVRMKGGSARPLVVFPDDSRKILTDTNWPWDLTGKIYNSDGFAGSGVLIGDRLVLTARHVIPWNSIAKGSWWMQFIPALFDTSQPFGSSYTSDVTYYNTEDDEFNLAHDYAVIRLFEPMGSQLGYLGSISYDDDWNGEDVWINIGYPSDMGGGVEPAWQQASIFNNVSDDDGEILETMASLAHGNSGGPFFDWFNDNQVQVAGVVSSGGTINGVLMNTLAGGDEMVELINWARANWPL